MVVTRLHSGFAIAVGELSNVNNAVLVSNFVVALQLLVCLTIKSHFCSFQVEDLCHVIASWALMEHQALIPVTATLAAKYVSTLLLAFFVLFQIGGGGFGGKENLESILIG